MKKLFSTLMLVLVALTVQAQILQPVEWKIQLNDSGTAEKEIVFTATADKGWHLYDQDLPEGGPVSTSFTFETLKGAELIGKPTSSVKPTTVYDELFAMNLRWYPGTVSFTQKFKATDPAKFKAEGEVEFMACNDETCLPPDRVSFSFDKKNIKMTAATETTNAVMIFPSTDKIFSSGVITASALSIKSAILPISVFCPVPTTSAFACPPTTNVEEKSIFFRSPREVFLSLRISAFFFTPCDSPVRADSSHLSASHSKILQSAGTMFPSSR